MSTTTNKYNLVKPQLTDSADITAMNVNWDKLDEVLSTKYGTDNKPKASDVGAAPSNHTHDDRYYTETEVNNLIDGVKPFIVNISDNGESFTADKTFSEVLAAYNSGKTLMAYYNEYKIPLTQVDVNQYIVFQTGTDYGYLAFLILVDNTVGSIFETFSYSDHHHFPSDIKSGTFASYVKANADGQDPATSLLRNIKAGTSDLTAGSSSLATGELYFVYE